MVKYERVLHSNMFSLKKTMLRSISECTEEKSVCIEKACESIAISI